jgi:hypothetical protein
MGDELQVIVEKRFSPQRRKENSRIAAMLCAFA